MGLRSSILLSGLAIAVDLGGCCLDVSGHEIGGSAGSVSASGANATAAATSSGTGNGKPGSSTGGSSSSAGTSTGVSTTFEDAGPLPGALWIGGTGALITDGLPMSGLASFDLKCPFPSAALANDLGGLAVVDGLGDLWVQDSNGTLYVWSPEQLGQSCNSATPMRTLTLEPMAAMAFDAEGNLWGTIASPAQVVGYRAGDLVQSGAPAAAWTLTTRRPPASLSRPAGLAFDAKGVLWVADTELLAFTPATRLGLEDGGPSAGAWIIWPCPGVLQGESCEDWYPDTRFGALAFDDSGNLWATTNAFRGQIVEYTASQLAKASSFAGHLQVPGGDLPIYVSPVSPANSGALAFDQAGSLWAGFSVDADDGGSSANLERYHFLPAPGRSPASFFAPDLQITVPGAPGASLAFSPIPAGLPIQP